MIDVHCDKSPSGRHDAKPVWRFDGLEFRCGCCGEYLPVTDITNFINAALRLTAEEAEARAVRMETWLMGGSSWAEGTEPRDDTLRNYAACWRGESDE